MQFGTPDGVVRAVDGVDFDLRADETLALVGESGCGKSVTALALARLVAGPGLRTSGRVELDGHDMAALSEHELRSVRGGTIAYVFQDPASSLNPVKTVGSQIGEMVRLHRRVPDVQAEVVALMQMVGLPDPANRYRPSANPSRPSPHPGSEGMDGGESLVRR